MNDKKKIAFTGSAGFLGQAICKAFESDNYTLRLVDIENFETKHERMVGDVGNYEFCKKIVNGMDMLVIAHMLPKPYGQTPTKAFESNVTGTANLFYAAIEEGIKRVCLISSVSVMGNPNPKADYRNTPPHGRDIYSTTKACQEIIAKACHIEKGIEVAVLRVGYVVDCAKKIDKYGNTYKKNKPGMADRHDVGIVARKFLELPDLGYQTKAVMSFSEPGNYPTGMETFEFLNWKSQFDKNDHPLVKAGNMPNVNKEIATGQKANCKQ